MEIRHLEKGGFRANIATLPHPLAGLKKAQFGRGMSGLDLAFAAVVGVPVMVALTFLTRGIPGSSGVSAGVFFALFLVQRAAASTIQLEPHQILDLDRGQVAVADHKKRVLFRAPLEEVDVRLGGGLHLVAGDRSFHLQSREDLRPLLELIERARDQHGDRSDVPEAIQQRDRVADA